MKKTFIGLSALIGVALTSAGATAAPIATFSPTSYVQGGTITNLAAGLSITGILYDLVPDAGAPGPGTPIWDTLASSSASSPVFSNFAPDPRYAFTVSWSGLSISTGSTFVTGFIDYDGFTGSSYTGGGSTSLDGSEFMRLFFSNGSSSTAFLPAGNPNSTGIIEFLAFDGPVTPVPAPGALLLVGAGLAALGMRRKHA